MYGKQFQQGLDEPGMVVNPARGQLHRETYFFPYLRSHLRISPRETGSTVPSCVSLVILHIQANSGDYSRGSSRFPLLRLYIFIVICHRVSLNLVGSRKCVQMAFTAKSPPAQDI